jgi:hypothetical protein
LLLMLLLLLLLALRGMKPKQKMSAAGTEYEEPLTVTCTARTPASVDVVGTHGLRRPPCMTPATCTPRRSHAQHLTCAGGMDLRP